MVRWTVVASYIEESSSLIKKLTGLESQILKSAVAWNEALRAGRKVIFCGNGGSAADAQHLAAELMGRFLIDRNPLPALSLTVDTSALTAIGNDYGYANIFSRQLRGIGVGGDVLVGISTSGNSENLVEAFKAARELEITTIGLTGLGGGKMAAFSDILVEVPDNRTSHIQEAHIVIGHMICALVEDSLCSPRQ